MSPEIVITGMGTVLPCGNGLEAAREAWRTRTPAFATLPETLGEGRGAACTAFSFAGIIPPMVARRLDRGTRFAWVAVHQALAQAGLDAKACGERLAVAAGTMTGGSEATEPFIRPYLDKGPEAASPMIFPNCVAISIVGQISMGFGIKGPSLVQLQRENSTLDALDQACRWLRQGRADAALLVGTDALFPLLVELLKGSRLTCRHGDPLVGSRRGYLPGEGAQAFLLETRQRALARSAPILGSLRIAQRASNDPSSTGRGRALCLAAESLAFRPEAWVGGATGHPILDDLEQVVREAHPDWPDPAHPKTLWGEFGGSGGQLLAAALLDPARKVLVTAPSSGGSQIALALEKDGA